MPFRAIYSIVVGSVKFLDNFNMLTYEAVPLRALLNGTYS